MNGSLRFSSLRLLGNVVLIILSLLITLLALELAIRVWRGNLTNWSNVVVDGRRAESLDGGLTRDDELGWTPTPNYVRPPYRNDAHGFRAMPEVAGTPAVLAVGDSFTYGAEAGNDETWPFYLQNALDRRVVNAGVPAYGLDQVLLRTEKLVPLLMPRLVVLSFIADDVLRMERSMLWGRGKPYFELRGDTLELRNVPVPGSTAPDSRLPLFERLFGWSAFVDFLRARLIVDQHEYFGDHLRAMPHGAAEKMVCPLMRRLAMVRAPVLIVAQYFPRGWEQDAYGVEARRLSLLVLNCAAQANLATLDLFEPLQQIVKTRGLATLYGSQHHSAAGNRVVADLIAAELLRRGLP